MWLFLVYLCLLHECSIERSCVSAVPLSSPSEGMYMDLVFPAENEEGNLSITLPPKCHNKTFCENIENYPESLFYEIIENTTYGSKYKPFFKNLMNIEPLIHSRDKKTNASPICSSTKSIVYPKAAYTLKNELKFIYNLDNYKQGVSVEVCIKRAKCKFYDKIMNLRTTCKQKFVHKLLVTADDNGRPYVDRYRFPSACVCTYKLKTIDITEIGVDRNRTSTWRRIIYCERQKHNRGKATRRNRCGCELLLQNGSTSNTEITSTFWKKGNPLFRFTHML